MVNPLYYHKLLKELGLVDARVEIKDFKFYIHLYAHEDPGLTKYFRFLMKDGLIKCGRTTYWVNDPRDIVEIALLVGPTIEEKIIDENRNYFFEKEIEILEYFARLKNSIND